MLFYEENFCGVQYVTAMTSPSRQVNYRGVFNPVFNDKKS